MLIQQQSIPFTAYADLYDKVVSHNHMLRQINDFYHWCPIKKQKNKKIRADFFARISPFDLICVDENIKLKS